MKSIADMKAAKKDPAFGGSGLHGCGPKLPLNRVRPELDLNTPPPSPPPPPKEKKEKKKKLSPSKDAKAVAFAESVLKKLAEPPPPEPEEVITFGAKDDNEDIEIPWSEEEL